MPNLNVLVAPKVNKEPVKEYVIDFDVSKVSKIEMRCKSETNLKWFEAKPKKTWLFGLILVEPALEAGWGYKYEDNYRRDNPEDTKSLIVENGIVYNRTSVTVYLDNKTYVHSYFKNDGDARSWIGNVKKLSNNNFVTIEN